MTTAKQRKAAQRERDRAAGLIEVLVKIPADRKPDLRAFAATLNQSIDSTDAASRLLSEP